MMEKTFVMIKPDAVKRRLIGEIIQRFEKRGLQIVAMKMVDVDKELAKKHYAEHKDKPFFKDLIKYITSSPVVVLVLKGKNCISVVRKMVGATDPKEAESGTIRGDFALEIGRNIIHASDSPESAEREIKLFFKNSEIFEYNMPDADIIYE
ncbi:nucleoside diphosphate kinase [Methanothermus fervidus DSM 2088]|uniref:Nucleoside diphosphate kinase n=1 Tax=Methanothermus fervidus (strain ATCC 43054 / DSM 2088 / JCM 10308 / V24 S) TaxID=523846 RepID=E3GY67_METFV|nr:nucleoside-diphosphate kinase [Methanothermus fervidus]ADP77249.1 nucleoside diphosphate kinase [Methanothermus fervidus DSM 2088]